jgi:hypothetical protein
MKLFIAICVAFLSFSGQPRHDLTFKVSCPDTQTRLEGAVVKVRINEKAVVDSVSNGEGFVTFKGLRQGDKVAIIAYKNDFDVVKLQLIFDRDVDYYWLPLVLSKGMRHKDQPPPRFGILPSAVANPDCGN